MRNCEVVEGWQVVNTLGNLLASTVVTAEQHDGAIDADFLVPQGQVSAGGNKERVGQD